ncbi:ShlB/FhaC/HecB family hemolysin secretion/activation protein [Zhongshania guokunii]|uniref:ShlB/FhaC/HecB family hemolysin secretion/activation protein n=1 Tax=Zhongshania guokunii TaxID=641783 RepID=A0ABV3U9U0_9GAMM
MAIDFPSALPPQLTTVEQIVSTAAAGAPYTGLVNGYELRVSGNHFLNEEELESIFTAAKTPSQAIFLMNSMVLRKGHLLVLMQYAPEGSVVYIHAVQARLAQVKGAGVAEFFKDLEGDTDLTRGEFERARVMANVKSQRVGVNYSASFEVDENQADSVALVFTPEAIVDYDATDVFVQFGNQGSRYVGRYFGDIGMNHNFSDGSRIGVGYETAFTDFGESRGGEDYHRIQLTADRPFTSGLYGITVSHIEYAQNLGRTAGASTITNSGLVCDVLSALDLCSPGLVTTTGQSLDLDADINIVALSGEQVLASDLAYRFNLFEKFEYIDSQLDVPGFDSLQDEKYGTLEFGAKYFAAQKIGDTSFRWSAQLSIKAGVTGDSGTLGSYEQFKADYFVENPSATSAPEVTPAARTAEFVTILPKVAAKLPLSESTELNASFSAQLANEQLPQQQQWVLGGMNTLSAYLPGVMSGDSGHFSELNLQHTLLMGGFDVKARVFVEYGVAWFENAGGSAGDERSIVDVGVRASSELGWGVTVDAVVARPLMDDGFASSAALERLEADFYFVLKKVF